MIDSPSTGCVSVLDDDPEVRASIGSLLRANGYDVRLFESPASYFAAGVPDMPCCLVLDVRLSGESGLDLQDRLAAQGRHVPIILITGHGDIPMSVRAMRAGAVDFIPKPFDDDQLLAAITAALHRDGERRAAEAGYADVREGFGRLTQREKEVMALVVTGLMNKQVAAKLELSEITVKIHRGNVMRKMGAQSLADLVRMAEQLGIRDGSIHRYNT